MRFFLIIFFIGGVLLYMSYQEAALHSISKPEPQEITAAELITNGPGDNAYVKLSDFLALTWGYAYRYKYDKENYLFLYLPLTPKNGEYHKRIAAELNEDGSFKGEPPMPSKIKLILKSEELNSKEEVAAFANEETVTGLLINDVSPLDTSEKELLNLRYPDLDFDAVYILEHGRQPESMGMVYAFLISGILVLAFGFFRLKRLWDEGEKFAKKR